MPNPIHDALIAPHAGRSDPFLHLTDGGVQTYADFVELAGRIAALLRAHGVVPGDRVVVQAPKTPETLALFFGCGQAGGVLLPLNTAYTADEVAYFVADAEPALCVCAPEAAGAFAAALAGRSVPVLTVSPEGTGTFVDAIAAAAPSPDVTPRETDDLAALLYTSGTTGRSKGAMLTQGNLLSNTLVLKDVWRFTRDDVLIHALPIFHTHGLFVATNVLLAAGGSLVFHRGFKVDAVLDDLPRATALMGVPTFYTRLLASNRLTRDVVGHMRLFTSGSAPLLAETHATFAERTGHRILERYGMTETGMNTSNPYDGERRPGTVGFPLPGTEIRVADDAGEPLPDGAIGGIEVRGPNVFKGYWRMPEKTAAEFRADGFFITGDVGRFDADGYLHLVGRSKDLIISGGLNIYPKEVETVIDAVDGVVESAVIGVPHPDFGEAVVAVVVGNEGSRPAIEAACATALARFKHPKAVVFLSELPRNTMGKVQKAALRQAHGGLFSEAAVGGA